MQYDPASSTAVLFLCIALSLGFIVILVALLFKRNIIDLGPSAPADPAAPVAQRGPPPRRQARDAHARMRLAARRQQQEEQDAGNEEEEEEDPIADEVAGMAVEGKIGAKKRRKLEMKAEKRLQREQDIQEREERKQREARLNQLRLQEEERQRELEKQKEEEEKKRKEEKERQEYEEYLKLKESFVVDEEGFDEPQDDQGQNKFLEFFNYIKSQKVVFLEDLAFKFKMKPQDALDRLQLLLSEGEIQGVLDDRGKFICIEPEELVAVARFINQRGRVAITELSQHSHQLVSLQPSQ